jgi:hypothetical protein
MQPFCYPIKQLNQQPETAMSPPRGFVNATSYNAQFDNKLENKMAA